MVSLQPEDIPSAAAAIWGVAFPMRLRQSGPVRHERCDEMTFAVSGGVPFPLWPAGLRRWRTSCTIWEQWTSIHSPRCRARPSRTPRRSPAASTTTRWRRGTCFRRSSAQENGIVPGLVDKLGLTAERPAAGGGPGAGAPAEGDRQRRHLEGLRDPGRERRPHQGRGGGQVAQGRVRQRRAPVPRPDRGRQARRDEEALQELRPRPRQGDGRPEGGPRQPAGDDRQPRGDLPGAREVRRRPGRPARRRASSTRSSAATRRSAARSASFPARRRTTPS